MREDSATAHAKLRGAAGRMRVVECSRLPKRCPTPGSGVQAGMPAVPAPPAAARNSSQPASQQASSSLVLAARRQPHQPQEEEALHQAGLMLEPPPLQQV